MTPFYRVCPTCEPDAEACYDDILDALSDYMDAADSGCWRCEGYGLLVGEPDAWECSEGNVVKVED